MPIIDARTMVIVFVALCQIVCTAYALRDVSPDGPCEPGELVFVGFCNLCLCNSEGVPNQLCARSWCPVQKMLPPKNSIFHSSTNKPFT